MSLEEKTIGKAKILSLIEETATLAVQNFNLKIWGIELVGSGTRPTVRIFVDTPWENKVIPFIKPLTKEEKSRQKSIHPMAKKQEENCQPEISLDESGVNIDDCAEISRLIGISLEVEDIFADAWILEVSSPGLERNFYELTQLKPYIGHPIDVSLEYPHTDFENRRKFRGTLKLVEDETFTLELDTPQGTLCVIPWDSVKKAHLIHIFPDTTLSKATTRK